MVSLLTCTGDRREAFALCERWVDAQDYVGDVEWLVVDDGATPTPITSHRVTTVIRRERRNGLMGQLRTAWPHIRGDYVIFIEDDDFYSSGYIRRQVNLLADGYELVGERHYRIYHVRRALRGTCDLPRGSALARTAATRTALGKLPSYVWENESPYFDLKVWFSPEITHKHLAAVDKDYCVGIKGMPGRLGVSPGHDPTIDEYKPDPGGNVLREWVGDEAAEIYTSYREIP